MLQHRVYLGAIQYRCQRASVRFFRFATQEVSTIVTLEKPSWGMTVSPDGQYLLYAQYDVRGSDLMLVEGW